jgi:hypothetical protein
MMLARPYLRKGADMRVIVGTLLIIAGFAIVVFRLWLARDTITFQNKTFGYKFGEKEIRATIYLNFLIGALFIVIGVLTLFGILVNS